MEYNPLGNTGIMVSKMCFGSLTVGPLQARLSIEQGGKIIAYALQNGVNFIDTAELYETYPYIKEGMKQSCKYDTVISSKTYAYTREMAVQAVEQARKSLDRDYIDIFMLHEQESIHTLRGHSEALDYLYECKAKGIIKAVGASMHHVAAVYGAIEKKLDIIHPILNLNGLGIVDGNREQMEQAIKAAHDSGIFVFTMKPLGGGNLFKNAEKCLEYILGHEYIDSVAIGMQSIEEVRANIDFWEKGYFNDETKKLLSSKERHLHIDDWCNGCGNCSNYCSQKALSVVSGKTICDNSKCILCGYCSSKCPMWAIKVV
jgi:aryl-alcohol dehydrogenase-like predicted oxidoreductase